MLITKVDENGKIADSSVVDTSGCFLDSSNFAGLQKGGTCSNTALACVLPLISSSSNVAAEFIDCYFEDGRVIDVLAFLFATKLKDEEEEIGGELDKEISNNIIYNIIKVYSESFNMRLTPELRKYFETRVPEIKEKITSEERKEDCEKYKKRFKELCFHESCEIGEKEIKKDIFDNMGEFKNYSDDKKEKLFSYIQKDEKETLEKNLLKYNNLIGKNYWLNDNSVYIYNKI